jgi:hypothetical protein
MRWKGFLLFAMLGASVVSGGCRNREEVVRAGPPPPALTMVFEGLVDIDYRTLNNALVLSVLMVDATKDDPNAQVPPCVPQNLSQYYLAHQPAIFVQDAEVTENGSPIDPLIYLSNHDVAVNTGQTASGIVNLLALVSADELQQGFGNGGAALNVESKYYIDPIGDTATDALVARIRLDGADTVEARTNVCEKQMGLPLFRQKHFRFEAEPNRNTAHCRLRPAAGTTPIQLGEDVVVTRNNVSTVTLTLSKQNSAPRTITVKSIQGRPFGIAFRNTLPVYHGRRIDDCAAAAMEHYSSYRWYYRLEAAPGTRCNVAPCRACENTDPFFRCAAAGFKCPTP